MTLIELLDAVKDRESFVEFAFAFAEERRRVEAIEAANPEMYRYGGAEGWNNTCISLFIDGGLSHFASDAYPSHATSPSWKDLAEFLWCGMFME